MRALVTGAGGFLGRHLRDALAAAGIAAVAVGRASGGPVAPGFVAIRDVPDAEALRPILRRAAPDVVFHMAGATQAPSLAELYRVNVFYAAALIEACRDLPAPPRVVLAGSAAEYGPPLAAGRRIREDDLPRPRTAYGETKLAQTVHGLRQSAVPVVVARIFNPIGEGLPASRAVGAFIARILALGPEGGAVRTGPLGAVRDIADAADVARALVALAGPTVPSGAVYNLATGTGTRMQALADALAALAPSPVRFVPEAGDGGVDWAVGDPARLAAHGVTLPPPDLRRLLARMLAAAGGAGGAGGTA